MRTRDLVVQLAAALAVPAAAIAAEPSSELAAPVPVLAAGKPIDVGESGHAAPFVVDFDGDGKLDLLVGYFSVDPEGAGMVRVYLNKGTAKAPVFGEPTLLMAGGGVAKVPAS
jgi:FG-GAP repeat protein